MGRPRTRASIRDLIVTLASENWWGYTRVMGEIKKLGLRTSSRSTVKRNMKEHDLDPGPLTDPDSWQEFLKRHAVTLYECDFFSKRSWTRRDLKQC